MRILVSINLTGTVLQTLNGGAGQTGEENPAEWRGRQHLGVRTMFMF